MTTILAVNRDGKTCMIGDGQVTLGNTMVKGSAKKVRVMREGQVLAGFAGSTADAITLYDKFEGKLEQYRGNITRAAVELAKEWRGDKYLRKLDALLLVADQEKIFTISGNGDVLEPDDGIASIGSGGSYALSAARALTRNTDVLDAEKITEEAMKIASEVCIYTNDHFTKQVI